jgi:hypothetical protein
MSQFVQIGLPQTGLSKAGCLSSAELSRIVWLQAVTLAWMIVECGVSLAGAVAAHSPALLAFGADSFVELLSAVIVLLQFLPSFPLNKRRAAQSTGVLLFLLAAVVALSATLALVRRVHQETSVAGIGITAAALIGMPILGTEETCCRSRHKQPCIGRRCRTVRHVRLSRCRHLARLGPQRGFSSFMGRFGRGIHSHTDNRRRGTTSYAG